MSEQNPQGGIGLNEDILAGMEGGTQTGGYELKSTPASAEARARMEQWVLNTFGVVKIGGVGIFDIENDKTYGSAIREALSIEPIRLDASGNVSNPSQVMLGNITQTCLDCNLLEEGVEMAAQKLFELSFDSDDQNMELLNPLYKMLADARSKDFGLDKIGEWKSVVDGMNARVGKVLGVEVILPVEQAKLEKNMARQDELEAALEARSSFFSKAFRTIDITGKSRAEKRALEAEMAQVTAEVEKYQKENVVNKEDYRKIVTGQVHEIMDLLKGTFEKTGHYENLVAQLEHCTEVVKQMEKLAPSYLAAVKIAHQLSVINLTVERKKAVDRTPDSKSAREIEGLEDVQNGLKELENIVLKDIMLENGTRLGVYDAQMKAMKRFLRMAKRMQNHDVHNIAERLMQSLNNVSINAGLGNIGKINEAKGRIDDTFVKTMTDMGTAYEEIVQQNDVRKSIEVNREIRAQSERIKEIRIREAQYLAERNQELRTELGMVEGGQEQTASAARQANVQTRVTATKTTTGAKKVSTIGGPN